MNLLAANYSSWGSRILPSSLKRREPSRSVLPNEVVCVAHSFGLSAFRLQCLGCVDFVRSLSAAFNINPHFVPPVDSSHLARAAREIFFFCYLYWNTCFLFVFSVMPLLKKSACVCVSLSVLVSQEVLQMIPKFCFPFDVERYNSSPLPCFFCLFFYFFLNAQLSFTSSKPTPASARA